MALSTWRIDDEVSYNGKPGVVSRLGERMLRIHLEDGTKVWADPEEDADKLERRSNGKVDCPRKLSCQKVIGTDVNFKRKRAHHQGDASEVNEFAAVKAKKKQRLAISSTDEGSLTTGDVVACGTANCQPSKANANLPPHRFILAPMVGGSELAFRLLCRRYGADLCYTPMIYSEKFVKDSEYRKTALYMPTVEPERDRPLVAHFCGNDPGVLLAAAKLVEQSVDAIDLNLGCPQRVAHSGHFGSYLLGPEDRDLLLQIVRTLAQNLTVPLFCKIRLLDHVHETIQLCKQLAENGCRLIAVHARYRGTATRRRDGPAHLDQVKQIKDAMAECTPSVPIISNGNVKSGEDVLRNLQSTCADGVMSAEGILDDPALFFRCASEGLQDNESEADAGQALEQSGDNHKERRKLEKKLREIERLEQKKSRSSEEDVKISTKPLLLQQLRALPQIISAPPKQSAGKPRPSGRGSPDKLDLALEYLDLVDQYPIDAPLSTVIFHSRRMCRDYLADYQLLTAIEGCSGITDVRRMLEKCRAYRDGTEFFEYDVQREQMMKEELARKKLERENRKKYEARMERKAKREGKPLDYYLKDKKSSARNVAATPSWLDEN